MASKVWNATNFDPDDNPSLDVEEGEEEEEEEKDEKEEEEEEEVEEKK
jgi:hypothetical protein